MRFRETYSVYFYVITNEKIYFGMIYMARLDRVQYIFLCDYKQHVIHNVV